MTEERNRVLVIDHEPDFAELLGAVLRDDGLEVETLVFPQDVLAEARRRRPNLLVLDLVPHWLDKYDVLDALRTDPIARTVPVFAVTTVEAVAEVALASYNVRESLVKPFNLDVLLTKVRSALGHPSIYATIPPDIMPKGTMAIAEYILASRSREALFRWIQRLRAESPWRERPDLKLAELIDSVPVLVKSIDAALHYGRPEEFFQRHPEALERVCQHARLRRSQAISLRALIHEYTILRNEIWNLFRLYLPKQLDIDDVLRLEEAVNLMLDNVIEVTVPIYSEVLT